VHFPIINVEVKTARGLEKPVSLLKPRSKKGEVIVKDIREVLSSEGHRFISASCESDAVPFGVRNGLNLGQALDFARVERGINVNQVNRFGSHLLQYREVVTEYHFSLDRLDGFADNCPRGLHAVPLRLRHPFHLPVSTFTILPTCKRIRFSHRDHSCLSEWQEKNPLRRAGGSKDS